MHDLNNQGFGPLPKAMSTKAGFTSCKNDANMAPLSEPGEQKKWTIKIMRHEHVSVQFMFVFVFMVNN